MEQHWDWLRVERLPAYAPELNPVEQLWAHLDAAALANTPGEGLKRLGQRVRRGVDRVERHPPLRCRFLTHTAVF